MKTFKLGAFFLILLVFLITHCLEAEAQVCKPSGNIKGRKSLGQCAMENDSNCCIDGKFYPIYRCSPTVSNQTKAVLTLNPFQGDVDGDGLCECDNEYHSGDTPIVALSTGWYNGGRRCLNYITINANGRSVKATVVDECNSSMGCDADHDYEPPCANNGVSASKAVWKALGVSHDNWDKLNITWSDA
ncbi:putative ripening-related protein 1 [Camellia sinensis]|uniref:putative ripening-related protein 1 n=1 Tax=Camellia sinensis TaxID=4442 RepID=UPI0010363030|nr:putative ripening-related protein 1 [Camellia sinensis]